MSQKRKSKEANLNKNGKRRILQKNQDIQFSVLLRSVQQGPLGEVVIIQTENESPLSTFQSALNCCKMPFTLKQEEQEFVLRINNQVYAKGFYPDLKSARKCLTEQALETMRKTCFVIEKKQVLETEVISTNDLNPASSVTDCETDQDTVIEGSHLSVLKGTIGHRMMLKMGWNGGGLGVQEQGNIEPVAAYKSSSRKGLGLLGDDTKVPISKIFQDFSKSDKLTTLTFDFEFTNAERSIIHQLARNVGLVSKSQGTDARKISVWRKLSRYSLVEELLKAGGEKDGYKLLIPPSFSHLLQT